MTDTELKGCPFCGNKPRSQWYGCDVPGMEDCGMWETACCYTVIHKDTQEEAEEAWQARAKDSRCGELLEAAKPFALGRHMFSRSDDDRDTCGICGKNFRNTEYHFTANEGNATDRQRLTKAIAALEASHET